MFSSHHVTYALNSASLATRAFRSRWQRFLGESCGAVGVHAEALGGLVAAGDVGEAMLVPEPVESVKRMVEKAVQLGGRRELREEVLVAVVGPAVPTVKRQDDPPVKERVA